jgi:hypothetical protein
MIRLKKWDKHLTKLENEIEDLSHKQKILQRRYKVLKGLMGGKYTYIQKSTENWSRLRIDWVGNNFFHIPHPNQGRVITLDDDRVKKVITKFINNVLDGKVS